MAHIHTPKRLASTVSKRDPSCTAGNDAGAVPRMCMHFSLNTTGVRGCRILRTDGENVTILSTLNDRVTQPNRNGRSNMLHTGSREIVVRELSAGWFYAPLNENERNGYRVFLASAAENTHESQKSYGTHYKALGHSVTD
ncbi:hypothetical protein T265_11556 [Opisthorchis viverrini]|uniref:Uncharacterized protein n=1 Tax=Opisthorchis viverrini TaxID=6198 RepID=A0A074ZX47_OPIVI|nr:hypothetical protein T265_11556 [Opisthorchis viverrini]KER19744.1 hypothetical protein T265_11556 [Opisthorchis viverrini]